MLPNSHAFLILLLLFYGSYSYLGIKPAKNNTDRDRLSGVSSALTPWMTLLLQKRKKKKKQQQRTTGHELIWTFELRPHAMS